MSVYCWGSNKFGGLGVGGGDRWEPEQLVDIFDNQIPSSVACGEGHTIICTESYDVFGFGRAKDGQCAGHGTIQRKIESLQVNK